MILNLVENKKIITEPDQDYSRSFKVLLVDFEWEDITRLVEAIEKLPLPVSLFLYGSNDKNPAWCIQQTKNVNGVLLNMRHKGSIELLKGFLLGESNVFTFGSHDLEDLFQRKVLDIYTWLAIQYQYYLEVNNVEIKNH
jgi:hypothetical protein